MTTTEILTGIKNWVLSKLNLKQDVINDLAAIRSGSQAGSTAVQPSDLSSYFNNASYDTSTHRINFYHGQNIVAYVDASPFIVDGMVDDVRIESGYLVIDFNTDSGKQDISIPLTDIFDPSNYYNKTQTDTLLGNKVDKVSGKGLSTNDYTNTEKEKLSGLQNYDDTQVRQLITQTNANFANYYTKAESYSAAEVDEALGGKQNTINDLANIRSGAEAGSTAVQPSAMNTALANTVAESGVYDVTANNNNAKFASLSALLSSENLNTLIPSAKRKGGMSIKFVQSSDNKYVQYMYIGTSTAVADFTNTDNWEKINLEEEVNHLTEKVETKEENLSFSTGFWNLQTNPITYNSLSSYSSIKVPCKEGDKFSIHVFGGGAARAWGFVNSSLQVIQLYQIQDTEFQGTIIAPKNSAYFICNNINAELAKPTAQLIGKDNFYPDYNAVTIQELVDVCNESPITPINVGVTTGKFINTSGSIISTDSTRSIEYFYVKSGEIYIFNRMQGSSATIGWVLKDNSGNNIALGPVGDESRKEETINITQDGVLTIFYINTDIHTFYKRYKITERINGSLTLGSLDSNGISHTLTPYNTKTGYFLYPNGTEVASGSDRQINYYTVNANDVIIFKRLQGNASTIAFALFEQGGSTPYLYGIRGNDTPTVAIDVIKAKKDGFVKLFFINTAPIQVYRVTDDAVSSYYNSQFDKLKLLSNGIVRISNKFLLSGASMSHKSNGYFELAMSLLQATGYNASDGGTNIMSLANHLYYIPETSNPTDLSSDPSAADNKAAFANFNEYDALIISHVHNFDVSKLPVEFESFSADDYENNNMIPYSGNSTEMSTYNNTYGTLAVTSDTSNPYYGYSVDEIYAIGYDYVIKKWNAICYAVKDSMASDAPNHNVGKLCQIVLSTHWHDGRTVFNDGVRRLAKKWSIPLIKYDENVGFTRLKTHPVTGEQYSLLYKDTTGQVATEVINGVTYAFHPDRGQNKYIQKKFARILYDVLK